jgi:ADP-heptose:LPS heptosyltransferase
MHRNASVAANADRRKADRRKQLEPAARRLILRSNLSPGDILMLTAAVRDLHLAHPNRFVTDVRTPAAQLWENNPYVAPLDENDGIEVLDVHYPLVHRSNTAPYHFIHGYAQFLQSKLGVAVPLTRFLGDIHLSTLEKSWMSQVEELGFRGRFWILMAGGKYDFTAKWWNPAAYQQVVDHFRGRIQFVQCGEAGHWHPPLDGVINLVGKTDIRQFVRLVYHADGVVCPVTFAMHLAAAVETKAGRPRNRACVVIAGGREPAQWEAYPHHQFISTNGALTCCDEGGCWKSRCQRMGDGDKKDDDLCVFPVEVAPQLRIPRCMEMITPADVIRRIEMYFEGGALAYNETAATNGSSSRNRKRPQRTATSKSTRP